MKTAILTYHAVNNYGAVLQAYALQSELRSLGHNPIFVDFYPGSMEARNRYQRPVKKPRDLPAALAYKLLGRPLARRFDRFQQFRDQRLSLTKRYESYEDLAANPPECDAYICGSDQIWNFEKGMSPVYYLRFAPAGVPAIAYAASFGSANEHSDLPPDFGNWIGRFQEVSAREDSGKRLIEKATGRQVPQVLDPAFFLGCADWSAIARPPQFSGSYILFYALEIRPETTAIVKQLSKRLGLPVVIAGKGGNIIMQRGAKLAIDSGPSEFLGLIENAALVVSNSFHATVFSILFQVPFVTIGHSTRNARMESLLAAAGMGSHLVTSLEEARNLGDEKIRTGASAAAIETFARQIDWSRDFLVSALAATRK